jgi:hypothetical protein
MLFSFFRRFVNWLRQHIRSKKPTLLRSRDGRSSPLRLESLEERRMMSADTTIPNAGSLLVGLANVLMVSQPKVESNIVFLGDSFTMNWTLCRTPGIITSSPPFSR